MKNASLCSLLSALLMLAAPPDQIVFESWFKGPFELVPETQANTFTNATLQIAAALDKSAVADSHAQE